MKGDCIQQEDLTLLSLSWVLPTKYIAVAPMERGENPAFARVEEQPPTPNHGDVLDEHGEDPEKMAIAIAQVEEGLSHVEPTVE